MVSCASFSFRVLLFSLIVLENRASLEGPNLNFQSSVSHPPHKREGWGTRSVEVRNVGWGTRRSDMAKPDSVVRVLPEWPTAHLDRVVPTASSALVS